MKNLLIIAQKIDENDDLLGFFVDWVSEFSKKFDKVFVITLLKGNYNLPSNVYVYSLGKENNNPKILRLLKFYKLLFSLVPKSDGIFAHMSPIFAVASWPVAFLFRKKIILWYLHRSVTMRLKLAERLSYKIVTAAKESLKLRSNKIIKTGHGIDIDKFKTERDWGEDKLRILSVGRISKIKNYEVLLKAAKILKDRNINFNVKIIGKPVMPDDVHYLKSLEALKAELHLENIVDFNGFVPYSRILEYYKNSNIVVGMTPKGGIDKTILEGMASGCLVLTSNPINRKYFGLYGGEMIFNYRDENDLAEKMIALIKLSPEDKKEREDFLVTSVSEHHRLSNVINRISSLL